MNNQQSSSKKPIIIFIAIIVIAGIYYFYSLGNSTTDSNSSLQMQTSSVSADTQLAGARVLSLLNQVSSLKIDKTLFDSTVFNSLVDRTIEIPEENVGRPNPFAPINGIIQSDTVINTPAVTKKTH